ncbi:35745_t:CDS:1 [Racocetra persica]|uniref:35745_t:CDS:1 n=1 Tax=Racocetra persica TaxID=160502 RepID=A0ACA9RD59_9GLOM|nr:35745_t:CDS:1 [Racocetra persica]
MATPTRANSCIENNPLASCFIAKIKGDSIERIYESLKDIALISKNCGGIGIDVSDIRTNSDYIKGSSRYSSGVYRMLCVYNEMAKYVDQGDNKRKKVIMVNLAIWHRDVEEFLRIRYELQVPELRITDLNHYIAIPDIFMVRVRDDDYWTIFSLMDAKILLGYDLNRLYGQKFNNAYIRCEVELKRKKMIKARKLFFDIIKMQCNTGEPFLFFIDNTNKKSNQSNIGPIVTPKLCTEIVEHTESIFVCNLCAVILPNYISSENEFDFTELQYSVRLLVNSCDRSIDLTSYPLSEYEIVNKSDRSIAVGIIGLATL